MRHDAPLGNDEAAVGLVRDLHVRRQRVGGEPARDLGSREHLVLELVLRARTQDTFEDPLAALDDPGYVQELFAGLGLELAPELVRPAQKRHVVGMLEVRQADDPREAMRRAVLVQQVEALEAEDALPAPREMVERRAPHPPDPDDDHVVPLHGRDPNGGWLNGPMSTAVENLGENRVRLTVDVSPDQVKHAVEHAMSDLSESVKIPGFRKGKIPTQVLVSRLGKERIYAEAVDSHIGGWFWGAASRSRVRPVADPQYEFELPRTRTTPGASLRPSRCRRSPSSPTGRSSKFRAPRSKSRRRQSTPRSRRSETRSQSSRPRAIDPCRRETPSSSTSSMQTARHSRTPSSSSAAGGSRPRSSRPSLGATAGETKRIDFPLADGSSSKVEITVREVQEKVLPDVDDELARSASEFDSIAELRASIEGVLREQLDAEIDAAFRISAVDELVRASGVQPALPLVRTRAADLLTGFARSLERRGVSLETYLAASGGNAQELERQMVLEAAVSVARELALEALAEKAGIDISDDDVKAYIREEAAASGEADADGVIEDVWAHGQQESIREDLRLRAALDRLVADVKAIAPDLAEARDKLWTPDKENAAGDTKLWTPGSKETA